MSRCTYQNFDFKVFNFDILKSLFNILKLFEKGIIRHSWVGLTR